MHHRRDSNLTTSYHHQPISQVQSSVPSPLSKNPQANEEHPTRGRHVLEDAGNQNQNS